LLLSSVVALLLFCFAFAILGACDVVAIAATALPLSLFFPSSYVYVSIALFADLLFFYCLAVCFCFIEFSL